MNIHWKEPDNANRYDLDYYFVTVHPGNKVYKTKDTKISDNFIEATYNVSLTVVNQCGNESRGQPEYITITVSAKGNQLTECACATIQLYYSAVIIKR